MRFLVHSLPGRRPPPASNGEPNPTSAKQYLHGTTPGQTGRRHLQLHYPTTNLACLLDQTAGRFGDKPAVIFGESTQIHWTYHDLLKQVNRIAGGLAELGVNRGDRVLLTLPNCPEFIVSFLAIQKLGAVAVNAGPLMGIDDLCDLVTQTHPKLLVGLDLQASQLIAAHNRSDNMTRLWVSLKDYLPVFQRVGYRIKCWQSRDPSNGHDKQLTWDKIAEQSPCRPPTVAPDPDDIALLQPTGGTTGGLKVAQLSHHNLIANALQLSVWSKLQPGQESVLAILPMFHVYGLLMELVTAVLNAGTILPLTRFRIDQLLETIRNHRPTVVPLVPAMIDAMCEKLEKDPDPEICEILKRTIVMSGAAPLGSATLKRFQQVTGAQLVQGYGLTEASPVALANPVDEPQSLSVGLPLPDTKVRVVNVDNPLVEVPLGEPGELLISGPQVFQGYLNNEQATNSVLTTDKKGRRWLHTGDVVRVDDRGFYSVVDRIKHMIIRGGLKVYPAKVERVLAMHPEVKDVAVIGRTDPKYTEKVVAVVVLRTAQKYLEPFESELVALCREHLARYEVPAQFEFVETLPRSPLGKLLKHRLQAVDQSDHLDSNMNVSHPNGNGSNHNAPTPACKEINH